MLSFQQTCTTRSTPDRVPPGLSRGSAPSNLDPEECVALLEAAYDSAPGGSAIFDLDFRCTRVNAAFAALYGKAPLAFRGRNIVEVLPIQGAGIALQLARCLEVDAAVTYEISLAHPGSGDRRTYLRTCQPLRSAAGENLGIAATLVDVTAHRHADAALREGRLQARHFLELNSCTQWTSDAAGESIEISNRLEMLGSLPMGKLSSSTWLQALHPEDAPRVDQLWHHSMQTGATFDGEYRLHVAGTGWRWLRGRAVCRRDEEGRIVQWYGMVEDIHERRQIEEDLREKTRRLEAATRQLALLVRKDHLTGLANRRHFDRTLQREVRLARRSGHPLALLMLDVDQFKHYNDSYGHVAGDVCLRKIGQALQRITRSAEDLVARYGGEEFAIVLPNTTETQAMHVASRAMDEVRTMALEHRGYCGDRVTLSVGAAMISAVSSDSPKSDAAQASDLIRSADMALYAAKRDGRDCATTARLVVQLASSPSERPDRHSTR